MSENTHIEGLYTNTCMWAVNEPHSQMVGVPGVKRLQGEHNEHLEDMSKSFLQCFLLEMIHTVREEEGH